MDVVGAFVAAILLQHSLCVDVADAVDLSAIDLGENHWIEIPTHEGELIWTHHSWIRDMLHQRKTIYEEDVIFTLYSRESADDGETLTRNNVSSLISSKFRSERPTRVIIHGWMNNDHSPIAGHIRDTYLIRWDYNVIVVDWSKCSYKLNYIHAVACVPIVGKSLAHLLDELHKTCGLDLEEVYLVGHSLGAHIAGIAGKSVQWGSIHTIVALDPALPLFSIRKHENRISAYDAKYVEVIHTNGGFLGFWHPIGTADFYPNGGVKQPGCGLNFAGMCAHTRSWELFVESLIEPEEKLLASRIDSLSDIHRQEPLAQLQGDRAKIGGEPSNAGHATGLYFIATNGNSPFFD